MSTRCRSCGARLGDHDEWCTLCFTPINEPVAEPEPEPLPVAEEVRPRPRKRDEAGAVAAADRLLEALAADEGVRARSQGPEALTFRLGEATGLGPNGMGTLLAVGGAALLLVVGLVGLTVLGLFL